MNVEDFDLVWDLDYFYGYFLRSIIYFVSFIFCFLINKFFYVDLDCIFVCFKCCFDFYYNCVVFWQDVYMFLVIVVVCDWFMELQWGMLNIWLKSIV